jgi:protein-disulfide isomerase
VTDSPELKPEETPAPALPEPAPLVPLYLKKQPLWSYFLTPAAVVVGAVIIAGAIWWTDGNGDSAAASPGGETAPVVGAVSTVEPTRPAATQGLLETFNLYARQVGLDQAKFTQCLGQQENISLINEQLQRGSGLGVTGTPTFFINNKKLVGAQPTAILNEIIDAELKGSPTTLDGYSAAIQQLAATNPPSFQITNSRPDVSDAEIEGSPNAKVMIAEFSDFQCPFCKRWTESSIVDVRSRLGDDVAIAFLHFPISQIHANAGNASLVSICAGEQGKFWEMHDLLFARQAEWADLR